MQPPGPVTFAGKLLWLDEGVSRLDIGGAAVARRLQFQIVSSPVGCDVFVSSNPSKPQSLPALWNLSLRGGYCCTPSFLLHGRGAAHKFVGAAHAAQRVVFALNCSSLNARQSAKLSLMHAWTVLLTGNSGLPSSICFGPLRQSGACTEAW